MDDLKKVYDVRYEMTFYGCEYNGSCPIQAADFGHAERAAKALLGHDLKITGINPAYGDIPF